MASYTIAAGGRAAHDKTLVASTVDTVTFPGDVSTVTVISDGAAKIYFTVDGTDPVVSGDKTFMLPAAVSEFEVPSPGSQSAVVKLISAGTPTYSVVGS
jgi:hypothetical protein